MTILSLIGSIGTLCYIIPVSDFLSVKINETVRTNSLLCSYCRLALSYTIGVHNNNALPTAFMVNGPPPKPSARLFSMISASTE